MQADSRTKIKSLRRKASESGVKLIDAFLLAGLHPSNITLWSKGITKKPRGKSFESVELAIELLAEVNTQNEG